MAQFGELLAWIVAAFISVLHFWYLWTLTIGIGGALVFAFSVSYELKRPSWMEKQIFRLASSIWLIAFLAMPVALREWSGRSWSWEVSAVAAIAIAVGAIFFLALLDLARGLWSLTIFKIIVFLAAIGLWLWQTPRALNLLVALMVIVAWFLVRDLRRA